MPDAITEEICISRCKLCYRADKGLLGKDATGDDLKIIRRSMKHVILYTLESGQWSTDPAYLCRDCRQEEPRIADYFEKPKEPAPAPAEAGAAEAKQR